MGPTLLDWKSREIRCKQVSIHMAIYAWHLKNHLPSFRANLLVRSIHSCPGTGVLTCVCCLFLVLTRAHSTYVQVCTQLRNLRFFVHLRFFAVVSRVNDISRKRVANFAKIAKNRKANEISRSLAIFRSSVIRNDYPARNWSISRSSFYGLATALRCFTMTCRGPLCSLHRLDDFSNFFQILQ